MFREGLILETAKANKRQQEHLDSAEPDPVLTVPTTSAGWQLSVKVRRTSTQGLSM